MENFINLKNKYLTQLSKQGNSVFEQNGSIFPTITSQSKWQFERKDGHLHLTDGLHVYSFELPEGEKEDVFRAKKLERPNFQFKTKGKAAQVHRADPGHVYVTLHDGKDNKTYNIQHEFEDNWKVIPKQKKVIKKEAFTHELQDKLGTEYPILDKVFKGIDLAGRLGIRSIMGLGQNPTNSMLLGAGLGGLYDLGKRTFYNTKKENEEETPAQRIARYVIPAIGLGATGKAAQLFPNYYKFHPLYRP